MIGSTAVDSIALEEFVELVKRRYSVIYKKNLNANLLEPSQIDQWMTDKAVFDEFLYNYNNLHDQCRYIFQAKNSYNLVYWYIGETVKACKKSNGSRSFICNLTKTIDFIEIDREILFAVLMVLFDKLRRDVIQGRNWPKWFYSGNDRQRYNVFLQDYNRIYKNKFLIRKILTQAKQSGEYISNQADALKKSKIWTYDQVHKYCNNGSEWLRYFKTEKAFEAAVERLYTECYEIFLKKQVKEPVFDDDYVKKRMSQYRISKKSCRRYLKYLGLMASISRRVNRHIEINAEKERSVFLSAYSIFRQACSNLKWLVCTDPTYYRGVRSKSFLVRVFADKKARPCFHLKLNNIEKKIRSIKNDMDMAQYAERISEGAGSYIHQRLFVIETQDNVKGVNQDISRVMLYAMRHSNKPDYDRIKFGKDVKGIYAKAVGKFKDTYSRFGKFNDVTSYVKKIDWDNRKINSFALLG